MRPRVCFLLLVLPLVLMSCCRHKELKGQARFGQLKMKPPLRVILFRATCVDQENLCEMIDTNHVTELVAKELEFRGFTVIDGATLVKDARSRDSAGGGIQLNGKRFLDGGGVKQSGSLYDDLPPEARRALMAEAHADGTVRVRLTGQGYSSGYIRDAEMQVRLGLGLDELPGWTSRCALTGATMTNIGGIPLWSEALDQAVRCVLDAAQTES